MLRNYLKIAYYNFFRNKTFSLINVVGLTLGLVCTILVFLWINYELSFDNYHNEADRIYLMYGKIKLASNTVTQPTTSYALARDLKQMYPEVEAFASLIPIGDDMLFESSIPGKAKGERFLEKEGMISDSSLFNIFNFPFIMGNPKTALTNPLSIVLSESMAKKYFGKENPMGKIIRIDNANDFAVTGVMKDIPYNSHKRFGFLLPISYLRKITNGLDYYGNNSCFNYLKLSKNCNLPALSKKASEYFTKKNNNALTLKVLFESLPRVHLYGYAYPPKIVMVWVLAIVALFTLIIACFNFICLTTARMAQRAKEVAIRKVAGAMPVQLFSQFMIETLLLTVIALNFAVIIVRLLLPSFNQVIREYISFSYNWRVLTGLGTILLMTSFLAGAYPSLIMSFYKPAKILKSGDTGRSKSFFRKLNVIVQLTISMVFVIVIVVNYYQGKCLAQLGFKTDNVIYVELRDDIAKKMDPVKHELLKHRAIQNVTTSRELPIRDFNIEVEWGTVKGEKNGEMFTTSVGFDFQKALGLQMKQGRFYATDYPSDSIDAIVVNEKAIKGLGFKDAIGKQFYISGKRYRIIGVIQDYHFIPKVFAIGAQAIFIQKRVSGYALITIDPAFLGKSKNRKVISDYVKKSFEQFNPLFPIDYQFLNDYTFKEARFVEAITILVNYFSLLALFIACIGLYGLSSFVTIQRTKEIGVRKTNGATVMSISALLFKEYVKILTITILISWPIAYLILKGMLQSFAYKVNISIWYFVVSTAFISILVIAAVLIQSLQAAKRNPVEALRYE